MIISGFERLGRIVIGGVFLIVPSYVPVHTFIYWAFTIPGLILILTGLVGYSPSHQYKNSTKKK
jgi:hypothetical protein